MRHHPGPEGLLHVRAGERGGRRLLRRPPPRRGVPPVHGRHDRPRRSGGDGRGGRQDAARLGRGPFGPAGRDPGRGQPGHRRDPDGGRFRVDGRGRLRAGPRPPRVRQRRPSARLPGAAPRTRAPTGGHRRPAGRSRGQVLGHADAGGPPRRPVPRGDRRPDGDGRREGRVVRRCAAGGPAGGGPRRTARPDVPPDPRRRQGIPRRRLPNATTSP